MTPAKPSDKTPPKPGKDVIYLDVDDDITTIVDKVEGAKNKVAALVLPKRFATLQSIVNMRLLKRTAGSAGKNVVLITSEAALLPLAGAASIHVAKNLQSKPEIPPSPVDLPQEKPEISEDPDAEIDAKDAKLDYHRSIGGLAASRAVDEPETIPLDDAEEEEETEATPKKKPRDKKLKIPNFERFRLLLGAAILGVILFIVFIILAIFVWPKTTITLQTEATPLSASFDMTTSDSAKVLDETKNVIPAALKTSDFTSNQQAQATGQQNNGQKATGTIVISGGACGPTVPSDIPAGTGASGGNGLYFVTQVNASFGPVVSGGHCTFQSNPVSITATNAGSKYNGITSFTISGYTASSGSATSGGTDNLVTVLSQGDVNAAVAKVTDQDKSNFSNNFKKQLDGQGFYVIASTLKAADPVISAAPGVGQPASTANISIKITYSALVVLKSDLKKVVTDQLNKQIDLTKQKIGTDDVLKNVTVNVQSQSSPTNATLTIGEDTTAVPIIDVTSLKKQVGGKKAGDIKSLLSSYPGVKNVDVKMSPFWVSKAPSKPSHIIINLQQVKSSSSGS